MEDKLRELWFFLAPNEETLVQRMAILMIATAILTFLMLLFLSAPYGRYSNASWGILLNAKIAWLIQELPAFIIPVLMLYQSRSIGISNYLFLTFFIGHYFNRALIYPFLINGGKPTPFIPFALAFIFCTYNGYMQSSQLLTLSSYPPGWLAKPWTILGMGMFIMGFAINNHSDHILRNLRKPGESGYKIPKGGAFEYVSGANFLGEIIEWTGFAVMTQSLPAVAFAIFTACNIAPRAIQHHKWYLKKFEDYPKNRRAIIPFVI